VVGIEAVKLTVVAGAPMAIGVPLQAPGSELKKYSAAVMFCAGKRNKHKRQQSAQTIFFITDDLK
jgi:hypothetical protein